MVMGAVLVVLGSAGCPTDPCEGPVFTGGTPISNRVNASQVYAMGDVDGDGTRDLVALEPSNGTLVVLQGPDFVSEIVDAQVPDVVRGAQTSRYAIAIHNPDPIGSRRRGLLYILDRTEAVVRAYSVGDEIEKIYETVISLEPDTTATNPAWSVQLKTTAFTVLWDGPYPISRRLFVLAHTLDTMSGVVELEFFTDDGLAYDHLTCKQRVGNRCLTSIPVEGEVEYFLADWDKGARSNLGENVDVIALVRNPESVNYSVWFGENGWSSRDVLSGDSSIPIDDNRSRLSARPIDVVVGADTSTGGSGGWPSCPPISACTCSVSVRPPTLFAINRCGERSPSRAPEIFRLSTPTPSFFQSPWLRDYSCPSTPPITD